MNAARAALSVAGLAAVLVSGCRSKTPAPATESTTQSASAAQAAIAPADAGTVAGTVKFDGKAAERVPIDMSMDPACAMLGGKNASEQYVITAGKLANVYVYVKSGAKPSRAPAGAPAVVLDQKGCRYTPHVIAVQQGGTVEFRNSDPTMHNIHTLPASGNPSVDVSQGPMGQPQVKTFSSPETMLPVRCNNHPWMNAFINVADTPFFAVTGTDGSFRITGLPPGKYTLAAVHEKLGEQDVDIMVTPQGTAKAEFTFAQK